MTLDMVTKTIWGGNEEAHDKSYLRQFEGFMEDYEAVHVSVALPPPLSVI